MLKVVLGSAIMTLVIAAQSVCGAAEPPRVVASIKPIHSLVAGVMLGAGEPTLLVPSGASPHTYSLRPSDARALQNSDLVFWVGEGMETFLQKPLAALARQARVVELADAPGLTLLPYRNGGPWEAHVHGPSPAGDGDDHDDHNEDQGHQHAQTDEPGNRSVDLHLWLDAGNAEVLVRTVAAALASADPDRSQLYAANAGRMIERIRALDAGLAASLAPLAGRPYIIFHDAYQYLEHRYGLTPAGSITVSPDRQPSAQRVAAIRARIVGQGVVCVFGEPQFEPALIRTLIEDTPVRTGVLDPDGGMGVPPGPEAYVTMMQNLGQSIRECLQR